MASNPLLDVLSPQQSRPNPSKGGFGSLDNLLYLVVPDGCNCVNVVYPIDVYVWVSDSAAASVTAVAVNALKEA